MKTIIIWLWGACLSSLWWVGTMTKIAPLIAFTIIGSVITLVIFGFFCRDHWEIEKRG